MFSFNYDFAIALLDGLSNVVRHINVNSSDKQNKEQKNCLYNFFTLYSVHWNALLMSKELHSN